MSVRIHLLVAAWLGVSAGAGAQTLYVAVDGNDSWSGQPPAPNASKTDGPLRTLTYAVERARKLSGTKRIVIRGGRHELRKTLVLRPEDSGVSFEAYPGEVPVLSGGVPITGWQSGPGSLWKAQVPAVVQNKWTFRSLFVNHRRAVRARSPNRGYFRVDGPKPETKPLELKFRSDEFKPSWAKAGDVEAVLLFAWADQRMPVRRVDPVARIATLAGDGLPFNKEADARYYIENAPEALDSPGEWYLDRTTGWLSYQPMAGEAIEGSEFIAPRLNQLMRLEGSPGEGKVVRDIEFKGLTFADTDWELGPNGYADVQAAVEIGGSIVLKGARDCTFRECVFTRLGGYAIELGEGSQQNKIIANQIHDIGAGGIRIGVANFGLQVETPIHHSNDSQRSVRNEITDNEIHDLGTVFPSGVGVWIGHETYDTTVAHNHIYDLDYSALSVCFVWGYTANPCHGHRIEFNHIHNVGREHLSDLGAVYLLGTQPGTVVRNNLIHDVSSFAYGGWGIYLDEGSSNILVENNVVYRTKNGGFHMHYGRDNTIRNNVFAFGDEYQWSLSKRENHVSFRAEKNIFYWDRGLLFGGKMHVKPEWQECNKPIVFEPGGKPTYAQPEEPCKSFQLDNNIYFDARSRAPRIFDADWATWQKRGQDQNSQVTNPLFVNASGYQFELRPDSIAHKLGIQSIDVSKVGPRNHRGQVPQ